MPAPFPFPEIPLLDHHCHPLLREQPETVEGFRAMFTESDVAEVVRDHVPMVLFYRRALRDLAHYFGCPPTEVAVLAARKAVPFEQRTRALLAHARFGGLLLDMGYRPEAHLTLEEMRGITGIPVLPILRVETVAETLLPKVASWAELEKEFLAELQAQAEAVVAFKSILAYRGGLEVRNWPRQTLEASLAEAKEALAAGRRRLETRPLLETLFVLTLEVAARYRLPVQIHTGFGDRDLDLRLANPLHLRPVLEDRRFAEVPLVLLHAHPYVAEAAWLAAIYPQVYLDLSLTVPFLAHRAADAIAQALALAPASKVLLATDAFSIPEMYWVAGRYLREALDRALTEVAEAGFLEKEERGEVAERLLRDNAAGLYPIRDGRSPGCGDLVTA